MTDDQVWAARLVDWRRVRPIATQVGAILDAAELDVAGACCCLTHALAVRLEAEEWISTKQCVALADLAMRQIVETFAVYRSTRDEKETTQ